MSKIKLFYRASYRNTRHSDSKVRSWLENHEFNYEESPIEEISHGELLHLLSLSESGFEELISKRSGCYKKLCKKKLISEAMPLKSFIQIVLSHSDMLRTPILFDDKRIQIGFNSDEIRKFIPRQVRKLEI